MNMPTEAKPIHAVIIKDPWTKMSTRTLTPRFLGIVNSTASSEAAYNECSLIEFNETVGPLAKRM